MTHLDWYDILFMVAIPVLGVATIMGYALHTGVPRTLLERGFTFRTVFGERFVAWNALSIRVTAYRASWPRFVFRSTGGLLAWPTVVILLRGSNLQNFETEILRRFSVRQSRLETFGSKGSN